MFGALIREKFPSLIVWHCANHRLELSVSDAVKSVSEINSFKAFFGKLHVLYHASPKNSRDLQAVSYTHLDVYKRQMQPTPTNHVQVRKKPIG